MGSSKSDVGNQMVLRDTIKEHRGDYYVTYKPADLHSTLASVSLVFPKTSANVKDVRCAMEHELRHWLNRFAVPVMVPAFDAKDSVIRFSDEPYESHLMGYIDPHTGGLVQKWGLFEEPGAPSLSMARQDFPVPLAPFGHGAYSACGFASGRPRPPCGPADTAGPQWLYAERSSATADYAPSLRSSLARSE